VPCCAQTAKTTLGALPTETNEFVPVDSRNGPSADESREAVETQTVKPQSERPNDRPDELDAGAEFERFEDLAQKLGDVLKTEVEEKRNVNSR
jgi:hypothetical protein